MAAVGDISVVHELARRECQGETFELMWDEKRNLVLLTYFTEDVSAQVIVPNDKALDAFYHPHAYL